MSELQRYSFGANDIEINQYGPFIKWTDHQRALETLRAENERLLAENEHLRGLLACPDGHTWDVIDPNVCTICGYRE